jgi:cell wall-associated NlpC family hydrolase
MLTFFFLYITLTAQNKNDYPLNFNNDSLVNYAKKYLGTPYKWGSSCEKAFDCSGFVSFVFRHFGITTPHGARDYYHLGTVISIDSCKKGDVILFTGTNFSRKSVGHVGIIISNHGEPVTFIHSSSSKNHWGVVITDFKNSDYPKRFMGIRRL